MIRNLDFAGVYVALAAMMLPIPTPARWKLNAVAANSPLMICTMDGLGNA